MDFSFTDKVRETTRFWINPVTKKRAVVDGKIVSRRFANRILKNAGIDEAL